MSEVMKHRLKTAAGRAKYKLRQQTVEPVFGIIKSVLGFRQFLLRGREKVALEWQWVWRIGFSNPKGCMATYNFAPILPDGCPRLSDQAARVSATRQTPPRAIGPLAD